ncbi:hypothetical protein DEAC_c13850 [Desulfosporosinus acididurans]|uniref:Uncharacterized protein n=1 Tax=Desulfosporosinus acididurans TaxID=476652 RepID=A0A0J1FTU9_9FIRM|nr:hypothetical protein [Desulfosporosinus acididurans]KLU66717.1 hypothetical protein DEAC_c13850 [Desulfosporosinus acididurans]
MGFDINLKDVQESILAKVRQNVGEETGPQNMVNSIALIASNVCRDFLEENNRLIWEELKNLKVVE